MRKVSVPRPQERVPRPFSPGDLRALLAACDTKTAEALTDRSIYLSLLDSGVRANEFLGLPAGNINMRSALITVAGKQHKERAVTFGGKTRKSILRCSATRQESTPDSPLWITYRLDGRARACAHIAGAANRRP